MSVYTDVSFINLYSIEQFLDEAKNAVDAEITVFYIKTQMKIEENRMEIIHEVADILRKSMSIIVLVIDGVIDYTLLDCVIGADICFVTPKGKCDLQSKYIPTGVYPKEQIKYLLAGNDDDIFANSIDERGNFLNGPLVTEILENIDTEAQLAEYVKTYVKAMTFGKKESQMKRIKKYFNSFKEEGWSQREDIMNQESRHFCYLAHHINEA